jgi:NAD(P)-dependent dehydrogenase (short-subunit alcohol dehydrogenase family)
MNRGYEAGQRLVGKVALVTAGAGKIGAATARRLAAEGASVMVADLDGDRAHTVADDIGTAAAATAFDAADENQVKRVVAETVDRFGTINVLHNNVAWLPSGLSNADGDVLTTSFEMWDKAMAINIRSYFAACKFAVPHMIAAGGGSIINTSSCAGLAADVMMIAYGTTKAAIIGFTRFVATQHGAQNIRCNAIAPGLVTDADMEAAMPEFTAMSRRHVAATRLGRGEDIAALVAFLASDESFYLTGECIRVDGGFLARMPHTADVADAVAAQGRLA